MTTSASPRRRVSTKGGYGDTSTDDLQIAVETKYVAPCRSGRRRSIVGDLWSLFTTLVLSRDRSSDLKDLRVHLGQLADEASDLDVQTVEIDLREFAGRPPGERAASHDARDANEGSLVGATTNDRGTATLPRGHARLKPPATPADADPMPEQEPTPAPTGAAIPLTTAAQVARRDEIWAKNRVRLEAARAHTA